MIADTNGNAATPRAPRLEGIMGIHLREGLSIGLTREDFVKDTNNIYAWCTYVNALADAVHTAYPKRWLRADYDFWSAVRLYQLLGALHFANFPKKATIEAIEQMLATNPTIAVSHVVINRQLMAHTKRVRTACKLLDGADKKGSVFSTRPNTLPGNGLQRLEATA
jgi:hypothetical protein